MWIRTLSLQGTSGSAEEGLPETPVKGALSPAPLSQPGLPSVHPRRRPVLAALQKQIPFCPSRKSWRLLCQTLIYAGLSLPACTRASFQYLSFTCPISRFPLPSPPPAPAGDGDARLMKTRTSAGSGSWSGTGLPRPAAVRNASSGCLPWRRKPRSSRPRTSS